MTEWQSIETAPINTDILVCVTFNTGTDENGTEEWEAVQWVDFRTDEYVWARYMSMIWVPFLPTHWMPLPEPPK